MKGNLKKYLESLFSGEPRTPANDALFEELYGNLCDRYDELIGQGSTPDEAYVRAIDELGDISPLIERDEAEGGASPERQKSSPKRKKRYLPPESLRRTKRCKALCLAAAVMLYILWIVPCVLFDAVVPLFVFVAVATGILIFSNKRMPDFIDDSAISYDEETCRRDGRTADLLLAFGVGLCILSVIPAAIIDSDLGAALLFVLVAVGVGMILVANGIRPCAEKGAQERFAVPEQSEAGAEEKPKKRKNPWLLPVALIAVVAVLWCSVWTAVRFDFEFGIWTDDDDFAAYTEVGDGTVEGSVDRVTVYWNMDKVTVKTYTGDQIQIRETYTGELEKDDRVHWGVKDGRLSVRYNDPDLVHFRWGKYPEKELEILVPQTTSNGTQNVEKVTIETISAPVFADDMPALSVSTISGAVSVRNGMGSTEIDTVSGDISIIRRSSMSLLKIETVSGNAVCHMVTTEQLDFEAVSGGLLIRQESRIKGADLETVSGSVQLESVTMPTSGIRCETVSGDLTLLIPESWEGFSAEMDTISGDFVNESLPVTIRDGRYYYGREGGIPSIAFSSNSGDLIVLPAQAETPAQ